MNKRQEIVYFDRYSRRLEREKIYGEGPLRWAYETAPGRFALASLIRHRWFSSLYGRWASSAVSGREIAPFIDRFGVDVTEFADPLESFRTFNDFFSRRLRPHVRPVDPDPASAVFPSDGRHLFIPDLSSLDGIYAKGQRFPLEELLQDDVLVREFAQGSALLSRLCPVDYHRFHFPLGGVRGESRLINGFLYSVSPVALRRRIRYLGENKRRVTTVNRSPVGRYLYLEIGATNVGTIVDTSVPGNAVIKGEEKGFFRFGGSMVILLFPAGSIIPDEDLREQSEAGIELYARCGDRFGAIDSGKLNAG